MSLAETDIPAQQANTELFAAYDSAMDALRGVASKRCRRCVPAARLAISLSNEIEEGSVTPDQAGMQYDLRLRSVCGNVALGCQFEPNGDSAA
jgi:hypothetical protein